MKNSLWPHGSKTKVAKDAGIPLFRLTEYAKGYLKGGRVPTQPVAIRLEIATRNEFGESGKIPAAAWLRVEENERLNSYFK